MPAGILVVIVVGEFPWPASRKSTSLPKMLSRKEIEISVCTSAPFRGPRRPPPKRFAKISLLPPPANKSLKSPEKFWPPAPVGPLRYAPDSNISRAWLYSVRFLSSLRISYASETSLKRSSSFLSPLVLSGCKVRASVRYFFLMAAASAFLSTPRIW